jgi:hypothetical protein
MRLARHAPALAVAALIAAGCQSPDVGQRCPLPSIQPGTPTPGPTPGTAAGDYLEFGNNFCDNLVCIVSPAVPGGRYNECAGASSGNVGNCGYCSKACVSDQACSRPQPGLACRQMVLAPAFTATLSDADREKYLADIQFTSYCSVPR